MSLRTNLAGVTLEVEGAVADLKRIANRASGWSDQQRSAFDRDRLQPLLDAGDKLAIALRRGEEQLRSAEKALRGL